MDLHLNFHLYEALNETQKNITEADMRGRRAVSTLIIYGTMALFWFFFIIALLKLCRCYFKDKWLKDELREIEDRKKRMIALRNGHLPKKSEVGTKSEEKIGPEKNEKTEENKELKELKVSFSLPETGSEISKRNPNESSDGSPSKDNNLAGTRIDFVEYI